MNSNVAQPFSSTCQTAKQIETIVSASDCIAILSAISSAVVAIIAIIVGPRISRREQLRNTAEALFLQTARDVKEFATFVKRMREETRDVDFSSNETIKTKIRGNPISRVDSFDVTLTSDKWALGLALGDGADEITVIINEAILVFYLCVFEKSTDTAKKLRLYESAVLMDINNIARATLDRLAATPLFPENSWVTSIQREWTQVISTPSRTPNIIRTSSAIAAEMVSKPDNPVVKALANELLVSLASGHKFPAQVLRDELVRTLIDGGLAEWVDSRTLRATPEGIKLFAGMAVK